MNKDLKKEFIKLKSELKLNIDSKKLTKSDIADQIKNNTKK